MLLKRIKHELLESNNGTVNMHATNCIFNLRYKNGNDKNVVCLILKRYAVRKKFKIWWYVVGMRKIKKYAVRKGGGGSPSFIYYSFNKTEASNFPKHLCLLGAFPFFQINYICQGTFTEQCIICFNLSNAQNVCVLLYLNSTDVSNTQTALTSCGFVKPRCQR